MKISPEARSCISTFGTTVREIAQTGVPFNVPLFVPVVNPFAEKRLLFKARYRLSGVTLEEVREGIMFADFRTFMDRKMETYDRVKRTRHFKINPFTKKMEEVLGGSFGQPGKNAGQNVAAGMVAMLGLVEWDMSEEPVTDPDTFTVHVNVTSRFFRGHFKFRIFRVDDGVILDDDWLPSGGGDVRTATLPMGTLVLETHPLGFEQITEQVMEEILAARRAGIPYVGQIGPELAEAK